MTQDQLTKANELNDSIKKIDEILDRLKTIFPIIEKKIKEGNTFYPISSEHHNTIKIRTKSYLSFLKTEEQYYFQLKKECERKIEKL